MAGIVSKAIKVYHRRGPYQLGREGIRYIYRTLTTQYDTRIRPQLPQRLAIFNGVTVRGARSFDAIVPWHTTDVPEYEGALVRGIRENVGHGETVVVIGGGWGVSTVAAAEQVGSEGIVTTFEGAKEQLNRVEETVRLNGVDDRVSVRHVVVARAISLLGEQEATEQLCSEDLPDCDVLVMDCEGAEVEILQNMNIRPHTIIVETHGFLGTPKPRVQEALENCGYRAISADVADTRVERYCKDAGIFVLVSKYNG